MKTKQSLICLCLLGALLLARPAPVQAQFTFTTNNGAITITGYTGAVGSMVIPSTTNGYPVTGIGTNAFFLYSSLTNVSIPNSITVIGPFAFADSSLTNAIIPASVTNIGVAAFQCQTLKNITVDAANSFYSSASGVLFNKNLTTLVQYPGALAGDYTISNGVISIRDYAFYKSTRLTGVTIPSSITSIGDYAFSACNLRNVTIPNSVTNLGVGVFAYDNHLTNAALGNGITRIQSLAFNLCSGLTSITIPNSVTRIENSAFWRCYGLTNLILGSGVKTIENAAFWECNGLTSVTIPSSVTNLENAFDISDNLQSVYFQGNAPVVDPNAFGSLYPITAYYLPGTTGWSETIGYFVPTVLWNPQAQTGDSSFGVRTNRFGFNITGSSNLVIVVEACTNFVNPVWSVLSTNTLNTFVGTNGTSYFNDAEWTNRPARFYRFRSP